MCVVYEVCVCVYIVLKVVQQVGNDRVCVYRCVLWCVCVMVCVCYVSVCFDICIWI